MRSLTRYPQRARIDRRTAVGTDQFGNVTYSWGTVAVNVPTKKTRTDMGAATQGEMVVDADVQSARWLVGFHGDVDVTGRDRIVIDGVVHEANGPAQKVRVGDRVVSTRIKAYATDVEQAAI